MKAFKLALFMFVIQLPLQSQELYFPPVLGNTWETLDPESLGWCQENIDSLYTFLGENNSKGFIVLKDGKIVIEKYFGDFDQDSAWYWASAGKSLTAFMVGLAQEDGYLDIDESTQQYLGVGWTSCTTEMESNISIRHQLTMTSGLDDSTEDADCTLPDCLRCLEDAGFRWAYHNAPYTLLDQVIESATGKNLNGLVTEYLKFTTGMTGNFFKLGYNNVFFSKPRSMARFGLLVLSNGNWNGTQIMEDTSYFHAMINTSQDLNESYGYLWWLNGKNSFMVPGLQTVFPGSIIPDAPSDMVSAMGLNGQVLHIVPSQKLVVVRMGDAPEQNGLASVEFSRQLWWYLNRLSCPSVSRNIPLSSNVIVQPNPARSNISIQCEGNENFEFELYSFEGKKVFDQPNCNEKSSIDVSFLKKGLYYLKIRTNKGQIVYKSLVIQ